MSLSRRALLRAGGVAVGSVLAGCTGDDEEFPPPEPTSAAPQDPTSMPTTTDWPRFQADRWNTGHLAGRAVPDDPETYWQFFVQSSLPVVAGGTMYTAEYGRERSLVARDAATGRVRWTRAVDRGGALGAPTVAGGTLVVQSFGLCFGFDRATGDLRWELDIGRGTPGSPVVVDGVAFLANGAFSEWPSAAFAVDVETGEERWRTDLGTGEVHLRGSVAVADSLVLVVDRDLVALDGETGSEVWRAAFDAPAETTPVVASGTAYVTDTEGTLHAVSTADGSERWTAAVGEPERASAAAAADGEVYVGTDAGLHALTADGEVRWEVDLPRAATPTVDADTVYAGQRGFDERAVVAVARRNGEERWRRDTDEVGISDTVQAGVRGPPTLVEGGVYVVAADGIRAFGR
jgi:outer membrane protein assembly factor BamB